MINLNKLLRLSPGADEDTIFGATDIGKMRENNEDYFLINKEKNLFIVSDGMGGHNAGEIASLNATKAVDAHFTPALVKEIIPDPDRIRDEIILSIKKAHKQVRDMARHIPSYSGMGCTIVVAMAFGNSLHVGHIGDSRVYLSDNKKLHLLTIDHTYVMELVKAGKMTMEEIRTSSIKNHLSQALGAPIELHPSYGQHRLKKEDRVLLCTDGLWDAISDEEIFETLIQKKSKQQLCRDLIRKANKAGGYDNITVVVFEQGEVGVESGKTQTGSEQPGEYGIVFSLPDDN
jgi:protein phosphatase